jgi:mannose-6-phosphate isomerase-like protein (cupin superfamily)
MGNLMNSEWLPGGISISHLKVYDWPATDGVRGGSPHLHTASAEGYVVLNGHGMLETLCSAGHQQTPLEPGTLLWFTPGTVHRLVNSSHDLEILVLMQNAGLPEAGDAVLTYPPHVLADPEAYQKVTALPTMHNDALAAARRRRDLAVEGYLELREQVLAKGPDALAPLYQAAAALVRDKAAGWRHLWQERPLAQAQRTGDQLAALAAGRADHLAEAAVYRADPVGGDRRFGMCGRLQVWDLDGAASPA